MLRTSVASLLHPASSLAAPVLVPVPVPVPVPVLVPVPCEKTVVRLEAEIQDLMSVVNDRHRYILELHNVQSQQLEQIPSMQLGADNLYRGKYDLRIDMEDFEGNRRFAEYKNFKVDDEKLRTADIRAAAWCFMPFVLPDLRCDSGNLNGRYYKGPYKAMTDDGVVWYTWHGWWYSIKSVVMMLRASDLEQHQQQPPALGGTVDPPRGQ